MMDNGVKLGRMANEIAAYFRTYPHDEAVAGVHGHIRDFWAPVMRRDLAAHIEAHPDGVDPLVVEAFLTLVVAKSPAHKASAGPAVAGQIGAEHDAEKSARVFGRHHALFCGTRSRSCLWIDSIQRHRDLATLGDLRPQAAAGIFLALGITPL